MTVCSFFEHSITDNTLNENVHGVVSVHPDNMLMRGKFNPNDLICISHKGRNTLGILRFEINSKDFTKNSIQLTWNQRRDLFPEGTEGNLVMLEISKGNFIDAIVFFFESLGN